MGVCTYIIDVVFDWSLVDELQDCFAFDIFQSLFVAVRLFCCFWFLFFLVLLTVGKLLSRFIHL